MADINDIAVRDQDVRQEELDRATAEGIMIGLERAQKLEVMMYISERTDSNASANVNRIVQVLNYITPGELEESYNERLKIWFFRFIDYIDIPEEAKESMRTMFNEGQNNEDNRGLICDFCKKRLPWGYDSWRCNACPMYYDVCEECRATRQYSQENGICPLHNGVDPRSSLDAWAKELKFWRIMSIVLENIMPTTNAPQENN